LGSRHVARTSSLKWEIRRRFVVRKEKQITFTHERQYEI
jgi:hypothetical protein